MTEVPFKQWSPSIHYAQTQTLVRGKLDKRRLYDCELLFVKEGIAATEMDNIRYDLYAGDMIFLAPGVYHQNEVVSNQASFIGIHFSFLGDFEVLTENDMIVNEQHVIQSKFTQEVYIRPFSALSTNPIYKPSTVCIQLFEQLVHEFNTRAPGYELICKSYMLHILTLLFRKQFTARLDDMSVHSIAIRTIIQDIENHPEYSWNNKQLAKRMNVNEDYMARLFKLYVGMKPSEVIAKSKHHLARKLLRETQLSIERIGAKVGYSDPHYFSRVFHKHEGISPREYRKLSRIL